MNKQLIITGFHRSGTSMLAQELHNAGLFVGDRLFGADVSNADGHYEDIDFVNFHEKILASHNSTWRHTFKKNLTIDKKYEIIMHNMINIRNNEQTQWGFKDPRSALFLSQWQDKLDNAYTVIIYRHYEECVNSLLHRASRKIAYNEEFDVSFWEDPTLVYKMWLTYNQYLLTHIEKYPESTIVVSHSEMINGFPIVQMLKEKFGFTLDTSVKSAVKNKLLSQQSFSSYTLDDTLKKELDETWHKLQALSYAPSHKAIISVDNGTAYSLNDLHYVLSSLEIDTRDKKCVENVLNQLNDDEIKIHTKISIIEKNRNLFMQCKANDSLIDIMGVLIEKNDSVTELYFLISDLYTIEKKYQLAEYYFLKVFKMADKVWPYFYNKLGNFYLKTNDLILAENAINKAITLNPLNPDFHFSHAILEQKNCNYEAALSSIDKALSLLTEKSGNELRFTLYKVDILLELSELDSVKELLNHLAECHPENQWIKKRIKDILKENNDVEVIDKEKQYILSSLKKDENYCSKINALLRSVEGEWSKNNLLNRLMVHLTELVGNSKKVSHYIISFVVDALPLHYYQAELLLYSLEYFTKISKKNIMVQCLDRVDKKFFRFLETNGYRYHIITPYLDGKYCNKLQQLGGAFMNEEVDAEGVLLVDTDTFFLKDPIINDTTQIAGKIVDAPNPPLDVLQNIFDEANIAYPEMVRADWEMENAFTFKCNFNGGFYYIPKDKISVINDLWRKWGKWLYEKPELFKTEAQRIHVDQVSMSLAIQESAIPYQIISSNNNCPIHVGTKQRLFNLHQDVSMLHYHRCIDRFGLLDGTFCSNDIVKKAVKKANLAIMVKEDFEFFSEYKKSQIKPLPVSIKLEDIERRLQDIVKKLPTKMTLIIHAGTPKTATTSLQFFLDDQYDTLLANGILYPKVYIDTPAPKHQWMVNTLMHKDYKIFLDKLESGLEEVNSNTHTLILSSEGIYNHWHDYSSESKAFLCLLSKYFNINIWTWFREPTSFVNSLYHQYMKNQRIPTIPCYGYNMTLEEMLKDGWFVKHLDYLGFLVECETLFGKENVFAFLLDKDIIETVCENLSISITPEQIDRKNISLSTPSIEILRIVNNYPLVGVEKNKTVEYIYEIDTYLRNHAEKNNLSKKSVEAINRFFALQYLALKEKFFLDFK